MRTIRASNVSTTAVRVLASSHVFLLTTFIESGNMLIMTLAHAKATGDGTLIGLYVRLHIPSFANPRPVLT